MVEVHEQFLRFAFVSLAGVKHLQSFYVHIRTSVLFEPKVLIFSISPSISLTRSTVVA